MVEEAPLETLLSWCSTAEIRYNLPVPENYTRQTEDEIKRWIKEQINNEIEEAGGGKPAGIERAVSQMEQFKREEEREMALAKLCSRYELTELGNSERLIRRHGDNLKFCTIFGKWYIWDGHYWKLDDTEEIVRLAKGTVRKIAKETEFADSDDRYRQVMKHAMSCETNGKIRAMISLAQSDVAVLPNVFDAKPKLFNCQNGTYELDIGYFREHRKDDLLSMMSNVVYDPEAQCPKWKEHLLLIFNYKYDLLQSFQEMCGYSLLQENPEQLIFILFGEGKNGKSVTVKVLSEVFGSYAKNVSPESLMIRKHSEAPRTDIARLVGGRLVTSTEAEDGMRFAESLVKQLTGGDKVTVRRLYESEFEFTPSFKIWFATNHKPKIRGTDTAIWRRILLVPFTVTIPEKDRDPDIITKLLEESPGIFNWCLEGLKRYQQNKRLTPAAEIQAATEEYRKESNIIEEFFIDMCSYPDGKLMGEFTVGATELYIAYKEYSMSNGDDPISQTAFAKIVKARDRIESVRSGTGKRYVGIKLKY